MKEAFLALFLILVIGCTQVAEDKPVKEEKVIYSVGSGLWSSGKTWNLNRVPGADDIVVISNGTVVEYDLKSDEKIANITVYGRLKFSENNDTLLRVGNVLVFGRLEIGTESKPIENRAEVRFILENESKLKGGFTYEPADVGLWIMGGSLEIRGKEMKNTWTRLAEDVEELDRKLVLDRTVGWEKGDHIFITSTSFDMNETEENYIGSIDGNGIELKYPLKYGHYGSYPLAAEVGLLTRNVVITSDKHDGKAHTLILGGGSANISYAEFSYLGPENVLSRYPIHFHVLGDRRGNYVRGNAIWNSGNRCITVHDTDNLVVEGNVAFNTSGHCFFLETGIEQGNRFINNLGALVFESNATLSDSRASVFWITNPRNVFINNSAASSDGPNYWFVLNETLNTSRMPLLIFDNNTGHSSLESALFIEGFGTDTGLDAEEESVFKNVIAWKSNEQGIWARGNSL
ncbi:hypothetical protein HY570_03720, partial [Candidatus Micrarchaeota archaeon]|nr:hypothetical protein [Candidatus Micrarchaeota archaeon]